jgi:hypothetical protein
MDSIEPAEIESIWERVKKHISTNRIKGDTQEEVLKNIEDLMNATSTRTTRGSMKDLLSKGFIGRLKQGETLTSSHQTELRSYVSTPAIIGGGATPIDITDLPKIKGTRSPKKIAITTGSGTRTYSRANIRVTYSEFKGNPSYYVYNTRIKKRVTWGVVK